MQLSFRLINAVAPDYSPLAAKVTQEWLVACAGAIQSDLHNTVGVYWPSALTARVTGDQGPLQPGETAFVITAALPDTPGAIAYHAVDGQDVPVCYLALSTCQTLDDISSAISHECDETVGDPECDQWDDAGPYQVAHELCDAVESNYYMAGGFRVSDFLLPAFFTAGAEGPYCYTATGKANMPSILGVPHEPFMTADGGYQIQQALGAKKVMGVIPWQRLDNNTSRTRRRLG